MSGTRMNVDDVMKEVRKDALFYANSDGGVTFGGGEPVAGGDFLLDLLRACRDEAFHTCVDTCGSCSRERFDKIVALTDLFLFDCKCMDSEQHKRLTGQDNALILANLRAALASKTRTRIRVPLMPGLNDSDDNIGAMAAFLREFKVRDVDVMPYHAFGRNKYAALCREYPKLQAYETWQLRETLERFSRHGLKAIVE
jgi:pyruvate formate lyase activating enzyme